MQKTTTLNNSRGMTIFEILTVVVIITILVMVVMPNFVRSKDRAMDSSAKTNSRTLQMMLETYYIDYKIYPESLSVLGYESTAKKYNKIIANPYTAKKGLVESGQWAIDYLGPTGPAGLVAYQPILSNTKYYIFVYNAKGGLLQYKGKPYRKTNG